MSTAEGRPGPVPVTRTCAECGQEFEPRRRGRPSVYCRPACRQRAWAVRQARASLGEPAIDSPSVPSAPPDPSPAPVLPVPSPIPPPSDLETTVPSLASASGPARGQGGRAGTAGPAPTDARAWVTLLQRLRDQLRDPDSDLARRPWEHAHLYDSLGQALTALDAATPGGLAWLERND